MVHRRLGGAVAGVRAAYLRWSGRSSTAWGLQESSISLDCYFIEPGGRGFDSLRARHDSTT